MSKSEDEIDAAVEATLSATLGAPGSGEFTRIAKEVTREARKSPMPIFIAMLAAVLALVSMANGSADKRAMQAHIEAANQFAYYQAKNIRLTDSEIASATFSSSGHADLAAQWQAKAARYNSEKAEILKAARTEQAKRTVAQRQGNYFSVAISFLQIAIVLASASLILRGWVLFTGSLLLAVAAAFFTVNGYGLYFDMPTDPVEIGKSLAVYIETARQ